MRLVSSTRLVVLAIAAAFALALAGQPPPSGTSSCIPERGWDVLGCEHDVKKAGGSIVAAYPQIDVVIAESSDPNFATALDRNRDVKASPRSEASSRLARGLGLRLGRRRAAQHAGAHGRSPLADAVVRAADQGARRAQDHGRESEGARRRHRHGHRRGPAGPERQRRRLTQRLLRRRRAEPRPRCLERRLGSRDERRGPDRRGGERPGHRRHRAERQARRHQGEHPSGRRATSSSPTRSSARSYGPPTTASTSPTTATRWTARSPAGRPRSAAATPLSARS